MHTLIRSRRIVLGALAPLFLVAAVAPLVARAQPVQLKLTASDANARDRFGVSAAVSGDVAVVGAAYDDGRGVDSGSAYVFRRVGGAWVEEQKLTASDGASHDEFGISVAVSGDVAVVGADSDDGQVLNLGSAYVFRYDGTMWVEEQKLTASDGAGSDYFGISVAVTDDVVLVGAYEDDDLGENSGSAYVFRRVGGAWVEEQKLTASDGANYDLFGSSVAVTDDVALVGAYLNDDLGENSGSAYSYRYDGTTWVEEQKVTASDTNAYDVFGVSVAVSGDIAVVGAFLDDDHGESSGSAYVFRRVGGAWVEEQKLTASDGASHDEFGHAVAVSGDVAVVGAEYNSDHGRASGSAYVFRRVGTSWVQDQKLTAADGASHDYFGNSVAVSGDVAVVGASEDDDHSVDSGSAYAIYLEAPSVTLAPLAPPVVLPPAGGTFRYAGYVPNDTDAPYAFDAWVTATLPNGSPYGPLVGPVHATLRAHVAAARTLRLRVPASAPAGTYTLTLNVGTYPSVIVASASFPFEKEAGGVVAGGAPFALASEGALFGEAAPEAAVGVAEAAEAAISLSVAPNPFAAHATVAYALPEGERVRLSVFDVLGREVAVLVEGEQRAGSHTAVLDAQGLPAGTYLVRLAAGGHVLTRRVTVAR